MHFAYIYIYVYTYKQILYSLFEEIELLLLPWKKTAKTSCQVLELLPCKPDKIQPGCCSKRPAAIQVILSPNGNST